MPRQNFIADKMTDRHNEQLSAYGATRRARQFDANNFAASLEKQTAGLGVKSAQKAIAKTITSAPGTTSTRTSSAPGVLGPGQGGAPGQTKDILINQYTKTQIIGGEKVIVEYSVWIGSNGSTYTTKKIVDYLYGI